MVAEPPAAMAPAEVAEDVEKAAEVAEEATEDARGEVGRGLLDASDASAAEDAHPMTRETRGRLTRGGATTLGRRATPRGGTGTRGTDGCDGGGAREMRCGRDVVCVSVRSLFAS